MDDLFGNGSRSAAHATNARVWDAYARNERRFARPVSDKEFTQRVHAVTSDPFLAGSLVGRQLLCLGSGGGMQSALYAAAGAHVTVVDISPEMLALDREVATDRGLMVTTVEASIDCLEAMPEAHYETVIQPVSSCYVPDVAAVYREVARVTCAGGLYVSQHKQPVSLQTSVKPGSLGYLLESPYYQTGPLPAVSGSPHREEGTFEFLHRLEPLLGGLCRSGFCIEDLSEPVHGDQTADSGSFAHRSWFAPPYVRIKARRIDANQSTSMQHRQVP
ncbi:MAG: class I SAM-dependent methyltransferase [Pirellulales bacterium]|nr:class I SAM-dependent methyltransferase [Pirellulales bacterium]